MPSYKALIDDATQQLYALSDTPRIDAEVLMQHVVGRDIAWLIAYGDSPENCAHTKDFFSAIAKRTDGLPIAYLTGKRDFWSLTLKVNEHVLIPRPDTETLVDHALERFNNDANATALDLGTGSGAIALSIAKERPLTKVTAVDSQTEALGVAKLNAKSNGIENVDFLQSNWFDNINLHAKFDLIASNPPYVEPGDPHLKQGDLRFEPLTALVADQKGLADLQTIIESSPKYINKHGWLIVEHGYNQASDVHALFTDAGFSNVELFNDINDLPRCTAGQWV